MDTKQYIVKGGLAAVGTIITYMANAFTPLIFILVVFMVSDYITGVIAAHMNEGISSGEAYKGAIKKFSYAFMVLMAFCFDFVIHQLTTDLGINFNYPAVFGVLSICWLISTDGISILENLLEIGVDVPKFLISGLKIFKGKVEKTGENKMGE